MQLKYSVVCVVCLDSLLHDFVQVTEINNIDFDGGGGRICSLLSNVSKTL